jgi:MFS family permease
MQVVLISGFLLTAGYFADEVIGATAPALKQRYGYTSLQIGSLYSVAFWPSIIAVFVGSALVDRYGTRGIALILTGVMIAGTAMFAAFSSFTLKSVGRLVFGTALEPVEVLQTAYMDEWLSDDDPPVSLALGFGITFSLCELGSLLGFIVLPALAVHVSLDAALWCVVLVLALAFILMMYLTWLSAGAAQRRPTEAAAGKTYALLLSNDGSDDDDDDDDDEEQAKEDDEEEEEEEEAFAHVRAICALPGRFWLICVICTFSYSSIISFMVFAVDYVHRVEWQHGTYSTQDAGLLIGLLALYPIVLSPFVGWALERCAPRRAASGVSARGYGCYFAFLLVGVLLLGGGHVLMYVQEARTTSPVLALSLIQLAYALIPATLWPYMSLCVGNRFVATSFGTLTAFQSLGLVAWPVLAGYLHDTHRGDYKVLNLFFAGVAAVALLFVCILMLTHARGCCNTRGKHGSGRDPLADQQEEAEEA